MALTNSPVIETQNLILRGPEKVDIEPTIAFLQNEERSIFFGALLNRGDAWRWFALNIGPVSYTHLTLPTIYSV